MRFVYLTAIVLSVFYQLTFAQKEPACKCADAQLALAPDTAIVALYGSQQAEVIVNGFIALINKNTADNNKQFKESIYTKAAPCARKNLALAVLCEGNLSKTRKGRYILYDENLIDAIVKSTKFKKNADWFILAHEVSHHVCNHLHDVDYLVTEQEKLAKYQKSEIPCQGKNCDIIRKNHIKELEADAVAVWLLKKSGVPDMEIIAMINKISDFVKIEFDQATTTHPSFFVRQKMANKILSNWNKDFANEKDPVQKTLKFVETEYEEILFDIDEQAKIYLTALENEKIAQIQHYKAYNVFLNDAKKKEQTGNYGEAINDYENALKELESTTYYDAQERNNVLTPLESCQKIVKRKVLYKISPVVGVSYTIADFSAEQKIIETLVQPTISYGFKINRYHWQRKHWQEFGINYAKSSFSTLTTSNNKKQVVEDFSTNCLSASVHWVFNNIGNKSPSQNWKTGFITTIGPVFNYYFNNKYQSNLSGQGKRNLVIEPNIGAFAGIGAERLSRKSNKLFGNYSLMVSYSFQNIRFGQAEPTRPDYKFWLHQIGVRLSYRHW